MFRKSDFSRHAAGSTAGRQTPSLGYSNPTLSKIVAQEATNEPCPEY